MTKKIVPTAKKKSSFRKVKGAASPELNTKSFKKKSTYKKKPRKTTSDSVKQRGAEQELRISEEKYRAIFEQASDSIIIVQPGTGEIVEFNNMMHENLGYTRAEFKKIRLADIEVVESPEEVAKHMKKIVRDGSDVFETKLKRKNGEIRDVLVNAKYISIGGKYFFQSILRDITERKRAEEALRESEGALAMAQEIANIGSWEWDIQKNRQVWSDHNYRLFGLEPQELEPTFEDFLTFVHPDDKHTIESLAKKVLENEKPGEIEFRILRKDGKERVLCAKAEPYFDRKGNLVKMLGTSLDITERKKAEAVLRFNSEIMSNMAEGVNLIRASNARIVYTNPKFDEMFGYGPGELIEKRVTVLNAAAGESREIEVKEIMTSLSETGTWQGEIENIKKDGTHFWCYCNVSTFQHHEHGEVYVSVQTDITERKKIEEAFKESEQRFRNIFDNSAIGISLLNKDWEYVDCNPEQCKMFGYTRKELIGKTPALVSDPTYIDDNVKLFEELKEGKRDSYEMEKRYIRKDGSAFWGKINVSLFKGKADTSHFIIAMLEDITKRKKAGEALRKEKELSEQYLDIAGVMFVAIDANQNIVLINKKGSEILGYGKKNIIGKNWFDNFIPERQRDKIKDVFNSLMAGDIEPVEYYENQVVAKNGEEKTIAWQNTILHDEDGKIAGTLSSGADITERKRAEKEIQNKTRLLQLLQEVSVATNEAATVEKAMEICLEKVCSFTGWPVGHFYLCNLAGKLLPSTIWHTKDPAKFSTFMEITGATTFNKGEGLPGRVLKDGKPHWITDVTNDRNFPRAKLVKDIGVKGAFAFPVLEGKRVVAVLEFFSEDVAATDEIILNAITNLATQLGRVTERKRAEEELRRSHEMLEIRVKERTAELVNEITERKRVEEALRQSEERIRRSFDNAAIGMSMVDANARFLKVNTALCNMVGYSEKELLNKTFQDLTHPDDLHIGPGYIPRVFSGEIKKAEFEKRYIHKNGHTIWVLISTSLIQDTHGQPPYLFTQTQDITERKKAEDELRKSGEKLQSVTHNSPDYIMTLDLDGKIEFINRTAPGLKIEEVLGTDASIYLPEKFRPAMHKTLQRVRETGTPDMYELEYHAPDGNTMTIESRVSPVIHSGKVVSFVINAHDITERKKVLDSLKQSEKSLSEAQKIANVGSWGTDFRTGETAWSDETYRILGFKPGEITPSREVFINAVHPDDRERVQNEIEQTLKGKGPFNIEHRIIFKDGTERIINARGGAEFDKDGKPIKIFGTGQDITEKKILQQQLLHTEKLSSIGTFVSGIAHELNTPLSSVLGYSANLIKLKNLPPEAIEEIGIISEQSKRAVNIVRNLLKFSRKYRPGKATVNINDVVESSLALHAFSLNSDNIRIEKQLSENLGPVNVDSHELQQVFTNVILNAQNAMKILHGNGTLTIKTEGKDKKIFITIENSGPTIPEERLKKIFDPFFTTKAVGEGTGLGLYVSYQIVESHGGNIFAENIGKSGVRFIVILPAAVPVPKKPEPEMQPVVQQNTRVLVVEDDETYRRLLSKYLLGQGIFVQVASDGREAVQLIKESSFDAVLSDVKMPVMDGYELGRWLKENRPEYIERFVLLTGVIDKEVEEFCVENNFKFMLKPSELADVHEMIQTVGV